MECVWLQKKVTKIQLHLPMQSHQHIAHPDGSAPLCSLEKKQQVFVIDDILLPSSLRFCFFLCYKAKQTKLMSTLKKKTFFTTIVTTKLH
jgi:hypothetical protein